MRLTWVLRPAVECAISLCMAHKKPPMCPFCRRIINGFHHVH